MTNSSPLLSGFSSLITLDEELVNLGPQLLAPAAAFTDADDNFDGGSLTMRGLLAEDILSIRHQGGGVGEIALGGSNVSFSGIVIGTIAGGTGGTDFTVTFNAAATSAAIEALLQNLTYENLSDTPTAQRNLDLTITDADGVKAKQQSTFALVTGVGDPFDGIDVGDISTPVFNDIDADGDDDLIIGEQSGNLNYYENIGTVLAPIFILRTGGSDPFAGISFGPLSTPVFSDIDGDGDDDLVIGGTDGTLHYYENTGSVVSPIYTLRTGVTDPFDGIDFGTHSVIDFGDIDADGDNDFVIAGSFATLGYYENIGTALAPNYLLHSGVTNPFDGLSIGSSSTPLFSDIDGDGDIDLVVGENNGTLHYYENTGTSLAAIYVQRIGAANPFDGIDIGLFSAPSFTDLDGDGDEDLVIGDTTGNLNYYKNTSNPPPAHFTVALDTNNPFTGIDVGAVSTSAFADIDNDGDLDMFTGSLDGDLRYYENTGTPLAPIYTLRVGALDPLDGVDVGRSEALTFVDIDNDSDQDIVIGEEDGILNYFENTGTVFAPVYIQRTGAANPFGGIDVGLYSNPAFTDIDDDGDFDLVIGETFGTLIYYQNTGTANAPVFKLQTGAADPFDGIDIGDSSAPTFFDFDNDGDDDLVIGETSGNLNYYENIGTPLAPEYVLRIGASDPFDGIDIGTTSAPTFADLDGDGDVDLTIGNFDGTFSYYYNIPTPISLPGFALHTGVDDPFDGIDVGSISIPDFSDIDGDGDADLVIGGNTGFLTYYENTGNKIAPAFTEITGAGSPFDGLNVGSNSAPEFFDIDGDGDLDIIIGENDGNLNYYENTGTTITPVFVEIIGAANPFDGIDIGFDSSPTISDIDGDGDADLIIGELDGNLNYYENTGTALAPIFTELTGAANPFDGIGIATNSGSSAFSDIDGDGDADLIIGNFSGKLMYYENTGAALAPIFTERTGAANPFDGIDVGNLSAPEFFDIDGDGDEDLVIGEVNGNLVYYENTGSSFSFVLNVTPHTDPSSGDDVINGTVGDDIIGGLAGNDTIRGHDGNDTLNGGADDDTIEGGDGDDIIDVGTGSNIGNGGNGDDIITARGGGGALNNAFDGGAGIDTIDATGQSFSPIFVFDLDAGELLVSGSLFTVYKDFENYNSTGGTGSERIEGTAGANTIRTGSGNNIINGLAGDDIIEGGGGDDNLDGGIDTDTASYENAASAVTVNLTIAGVQNTTGAGIDILSNFENLTGSVHNDTLTGDALANVIEGGDGDDTKDGGGGIDTASYAGAVSAVFVDLSIISIQDTIGAGMDILTNFENLTGSIHSDTLTGDTLANSITGGEGHDTINGGAGNDVLDAGAGFDTVNGDAGDDTIMGSVQADIIDGGADIDTIDYTNSTNTQKINLVTNVNTGGFAHGDTLLNIENVIGSDTRGDDITGTSGINILDGMGADDYLRGFHGDDVLNGGEGNDFHYGGTGADTMDGGNGIDWVMYNGLTTGVTVDLSTGIGSGGQADGDTYANIERVRGSLVDDTITGDNGINKLLGDGGADMINGMGGKDVIRGGDGDDIINGGTGNDGLRGDAGSDTFIFELGSGHDFVIDFEDGIDTLNIDDNLFAGTLTAMQLVDDHMVMENANRFHFDFGGGDVLHVLTTTAMALNDFYDDIEIV